MKPAYNRVDVTEVEVMDDDNHPREFSDEIRELRNNIVMQKKGNVTLRVKTHVDDMVLPTLIQFPPSTHQLFVAETSDDVHQTLLLQGDKRHPLQSRNSPPAPLRVLQGATQSGERHTQDAFAIGSADVHAVFHR